MGHGALVGGKKPAGAKALVYSVGFAARLKPCPDTKQRLSVMYRGGVWSQMLGSAAFFAAGHYCGVEAIAEVVGEVVDFVGAVDLDGFAGGVEDDFAVTALVHVLFDFCARFGGDGVVNHVIEEGEEFGAGHFLPPGIANCIVQDLISLASLRRAPVLWTLLSCGSSG